MFSGAMCLINVQRCVRQYNELITKEKPSHVVIEEVKVRNLITYLREYNQIFSGNWISDIGNR